MMFIHDSPRPQPSSKIVRLYALVSRMRVLSSQPVVEQADRVMRLIMETYRAPNRTISDEADSIKIGGSTRCSISARRAATNSGSRPSSDHGFDE
jgi:hypothetical protein